MRDQPSLSREELYELVWSEPVASVAKRYGISGAGLRKLCLRQGIPVPPRGHWAKVAVGKQVARPPLPTEPRRRTLVRPIGVVLTQRIRSAAATGSAGPDLLDQRAREVDQRNELRVDHRRTPSSAWARALKQGARRAHRDQRGLLKIRLEQLGISATIHQSSVTRLTHILAALEHACAHIGFLHPYGRSSHPTLLVFGEVTLYLHVGERTRRHEVPKEPQAVGRTSWWDDRRAYRHEPTGILTLAVMTSSDSSWYYLPTSQLIRDSRNRPLEERLNDALEVMETVAVSVRIKRLEYEREEERRRAAEEAARANAVALQRRQREIQRLVELAEHWQRAEQIRALVAAAEATGRAPGPTGAPVDPARWRAWALQVADELDPFAQAAESEGYTA